MIKSSMVSLWEGDNKLASTLVASVNTNASSGKPRRVHQRHQLEKKVGLSFKEIRGFTLDRGLEFFRIFPRYAVPSLRFTPMH
jgi:hypothetical protein